MLVVVADDKMSVALCAAIRELRPHWVVYPVASLVALDVVLRGVVADVVLLDMHLADADADDAINIARLPRRGAPTPRLILISGDESVVDLGVRERCAALLKPVPIEAIVTAIEAV